MYAIGNDELELLPAAPEAITCPHCGSEHPIEYGTSRTLKKDGSGWTDPVPSKLLGFYKCGDTSYLATLNGKLIA